MLTVVCHQCGKHFKTAERFAGRAAKCPNCSAPIQIPGLNGGPAPTADPAYPPEVPQQAATHTSQPAASQVSVPGQPLPRKLKTAGLLSLIGGIWTIIMLIGSLIFFVLFGLATFGLGLFAAIILVPLWLYAFVMAVVAIINGIMVLTGKTRRAGLPMTAAIMQIINVINCDPVNLILGIIGLVHLRSPEVRQFFRS